MDQLKAHEPASARWVSILGSVFVGGALGGGLLLIVAAVQAANYSGMGENGVYYLLVGGFWLFGISVACLLALIIWRVVRNRIHGR